MRNKTNDRCHNYLLQAGMTLLARKVSEVGIYKSVAIAQYWHDQASAEILAYEEKNKQEAPEEMYDAMFRLEDKLRSLEVALLAV